MNKGLNLVKGEWIYFLGSDDTFFNNKTLETVSNQLKKGLDLVFGNVYYKIEDNNYPFIYSKNKKEKKANWNWKIWLHNPVHHQATFYNKNIFSQNKFNIKYKILADYALNISLYKQQLNYTVLYMTIAKCSSAGVSKRGNWHIYKEEIQLKTNLSSILYFPFFFLLSFIKYSIAWKVREKK